MVDDRDGRPAMRAGESLERSARGARAVEDFLAEAARLAPRAGAGRLVFSLDATMSRQPTWDRAAELQAGMFDEAVGQGGLLVSLVYFRGIGECRSSRFVGDAAALKRLMSGIECRSGFTQIGRVLGHAAATAREAPLAALVHVGDAAEEDIDELAGRAGDLALLGVKAFMFQEGDDPAAAKAFAEIARLTGGAHCRFDAGSAGRLASLLRAVAAYATGGYPALARAAERGGEGARLLVGSLGRDRGAS